MLRAKQLSNLSSSARSLIFNGSRCSAADGSSCSCCEDDTGVSKRQQTRTSALLAQKPSTLVSRTPTAIETSVTRAAAKLLGSHNDEGAECKNSLPQTVPAPKSSGRSDSVIQTASIDASENDVPLSSSPIAEQFMKAGIAAVSFLSDLVYVPNNYMVDPTRSVSGVKSSNVKVIKSENFVDVYPKPSAKVAEGSNPNNSYSWKKGKGDKPSFARGYKRVSTSAVDTSLQNQAISSDTGDKRRPVPQRPKAQPHKFLPNFNSSGSPSDAKVVVCSEGYRKPSSSRDARWSAMMSPVSRQLPGNGHVVENVSRILRGLGWGPAAEEALRNLNTSLDPYQANQVLKQLQDYNIALGFFYWLKRLPGYKHDGHTYTTMVGILGRAKQFVAIDKLLEQMVRDGCQPNVVTYNRIIHSYGRANFLNEAVDVFNRMQRAGCEPDRVTYCTLIDIHAKAGYLDFAMDMYQRMQAAGLSPDTFTYSVMINCLGKAGHLAAAHKLFNEMVEQGCVPNLVTYNIVIAMQAKARNYQSALKLYRDMQNAGYEPDKVTYSIVMEVLGHCGHPEEAEAVFSEMKRKNWVPDEPVYGLLVDLWGKAGNVEKAWEWYQAMLHTGLRPNVPTCNSLLSAFLRVNRLQDAYNLLQGMLELGLNPSLQTYTLLLSCCTEAQSSYEMGFYCDLMGITGHPAHLFLVSMPSAGPDGQNVRDHAGRFLDLMHSEDRESKRGVVDAVVDFLHKSGLKEEAGSVWEVAAQRNVYPDAVREKSSCYWLINLHVMSDGTAVTALSRTLAWFRRQMLTSGISPSRIDIVTGWGRRSRVTGSSLVRQAVQELLDIFSFPFFTENGNTGCFVGCGEPLNRWLLQSYVDRMHLL